MTSLGKLLILCGPSTSGKTTLMNAYPLQKLITVTTRPKREGEMDGIDYRFLSVFQYKLLTLLGKMPERTTYAGVKYGILKKDLEAIKRGHDHVVVLDAVGVEFMRNYLGKEHVLAVYVGVSKETMEARLRERGSSEEEIERRVNQALEKELSPSYQNICDEVIWNDDQPLETSLVQLHNTLAKHGFQQDIQQAV